MVPPIMRPGCAGEPLIAACVFEIQAAGKAIQLLPAGAFKARDGRPKDVAAGAWFIDGQIARRVIAKVAARAADLVIDYEHQTLNSAENGQPAPAAGWFHALQWREGYGLFATDVRWTDRAQSMISAGEYRYLSPVFSYDQKTGEVLELHHVGLTNFPALDGMASLPALAAARFNQRMPQQGEQPDARALVEELRKDIAALKGLRAKPQPISPMVRQLDETALAVCQALGVSPENYLATLNA